MKRKIFTSLFLFVVLLFVSVNNVSAVTIRCAYSTFANACQIQFGATCPIGTQPQTSCPLNCSADFDIQCVSNTTPTASPAPASKDCDFVGGSCQSGSSPCTGGYIQANQCSAQVGAGGSYLCCLPGPTPGTGGIIGGPSSGGASAGQILCGNGINTAIGCIPVLGDTTGKAFASFLLGWGVGIGGGIAFLLIVYAGFMIMTSTGNPERLKAGQELLTSAISGLLLLIFSLFILNFLGVNILGIFT